VSSGYDFGSLLKTGGTSAGDAWQAGVDQRQAAQMAALKYQQQQHAIQQQAAQQAAIAAAVAKGDYRGAAAAAYTYGDDKNGDGLGRLDTSQHTDNVAGTTSFANVANAISRLPVEQRRAAIQAVKPSLVAMGAHPNDIDAFDPSDQNLAALSGVNYSQHERVGDQVSQQNADNGTVSANASATNAATADYTAHRPIIAPQGATVLTPDGAPLYHDQTVVQTPAGGTTSIVPGYQSGAQGGGQTPASGDPWAAMIHRESGGHQLNSSGQPLTSSKGAIGIAQVMPGTAPTAAKLAGLPWDESRYRTDPSYNEALGHAYYNSLVQQFGGDTAKAVAAYNAGPGGVQGAVSRATAAGHPEAWQAYLPHETQAYVRNVMGGGSQGNQAAQPSPVRQPQVVQVGQPQGGGAGGAGPLAPGDHQALIVAIAEGRAAPPNPRTKVGAQLLAEVTAYDPTFDAANATSRARTRVDFTSGKLAQGRTAINTAMGHLIHLDDQARSLGNSSVAPGIVNPLYNGARQAMGNTALPAFESTKLAAAAEMRRVFAAAGGGSLAELESWEKSLNSSQSYDQLHAVIRNGVALMASRLSAMRDQYTQGMGRSDQTPRFMTDGNRQAASQRFNVSMDEPAPRAGSTSAPAPTGTRAPPRVGQSVVRNNRAYVWNGATWVGQ
jgi:soluble lytic murein transglycosylase-like protein